jgi:ATP-dependent DNA helicase 2 subunit 1
VPPGLHIVFLPYADDIRRLKFGRQARADSEQVIAAKNALKKLPAYDCVPSLYNPALQRHYAVVQALALDEEAPDNLPDETLPVLELYQKGLDEIDEYKHSVYGEEGTATIQKIKAKREPKAKAAPAKKKAAAKRKTAKDDSDDEDAHPKVKREKVADDDDDEYNEIDWVGERNSGKLSKRTVPMLKVYLRRHNLPMTGKQSSLLLVSIFSHAPMHK